MTFSPVLHDPGPSMSLGRARFFMLTERWQQCAWVVLYPLSSCWPGKPGWPGERDYMENVQPGLLGSWLTGWPGCHVIAKLISIAFKKQNKPGKPGQPDSCNQALNKDQSLLYISLARVFLFDFSQDDPRAVNSFLLSEYFRARWHVFRPVESVS